MILPAPRFSFLLEDRVLILMRPQPLPRGLEIGKRLAMSVAMNVLQPGKCRVLDRIKLFLERARVRIAPACPCRFHSANAQFQTKRAVPHACLKYVTGSGVEFNRILWVNVGIQCLLKFFSVVA